RRSIKISWARLGTWLPVIDKDLRGADPESLGSSYLLYGIASRPGGSDNRYAYLIRIVFPYLQVHGRLPFLYTQLDRHRFVASKPSCRVPRRISLISCPHADAGPPQVGHIVNIPFQKGGAVV